MTYHNPFFDPSVPETNYDLDHRYHQVRSQITRQAKLTRASAGECAGTAPIGYRNVAIDNRRTVAVDNRIAPLIIEAFHLAAQRKQSLRKILAGLTARGLVGRNGKPLGVSSLQVILTNPFYTGFLRYDGRLYRGSHQPLVSRSLFDRVQSSLFRRRCR